MLEMDVYSTLSFVTLRGDIKIPSMNLLKPCTDVASSLLAIDLRLNVRIAFDGLQQKFQHAKYFTIL